MLSGTLFPCFSEFVFRCHVTRITWAVSTQDRFVSGSSDTGEKSELGMLVEGG